MSQLADLHKPPEGATNRAKPCTCEKRHLRHRALKYIQIQNSARNSCRRCGAYEKIILAVVDGYLPALFQGPRDEAERKMILDELLVVRSSMLKSGRHEHELELRILDRRVLIELFRDAEEQPDFSLKGTRFPEKVQYGPRNNSDRGFERAKGWLHECSEHHNCGEPSSAPYPKRLLDLREGQVRLLETNPTNGCKVRYVCLSHRWGDPQHRRLTTTTATIQKNMQGIAWEDLPKTFQDAVTICRRMSVSYLWIDSLCILQEFVNMSDDQKEETRTDFARENSAMASIYRNSYFTICASISTSMDSGIFSTRDRGSHQIKVIDDNGNEALFRIRESAQHWRLPTDLERRCWTYQEYLLSPRVLGFEPFDISWKCKKTHTCECGRIRPGLTFASQAQGPDAGKAVWWWKEVISWYAARNLTYEHDKLPALSGLAQAYHQVTGDAYLAGLWKASLPSSLCWYHLSGFATRTNLSRRPRGFRAPSWSWASVDTLDSARCRFWWASEVMLGIGVPYYSRYPRPQEVCTIYDAACQPKTEDAFGEVLPGGFVKLGAILIYAKIGLEPQGLSFQQTVEKGAWTLSYVEGGKDVSYCYPDCTLEDDGLELGDGVYCAPILEAGLQQGCLVLKRLQGQEYRRVGFCILGKGERSGSPESYYPDSWEEDLTTPESEERVQSYALQCSPSAEVRITIV
ncbi:heterokaryon incompatibility protein-domain-containing protein [Durotheca rogersii]|uniref:heterokaryon incompatibility protein-domain-containing protein n=1 Tax=Durotheca rogersii TaxID=419775 RepID=UPI00221F074C|nr:heterokaryon incompatibility protein-domain-containing protein [Durotheca rogersii]KAI5860995.1 heterokaryon incompatibility protein-domain-containing protein [Durotheca rogersii]